MKFKKALLWSCIAGQPHPSLNKKEKTLKGAMPLIEALFPGMNYFSVTGFGQVMRECAVPALKKLFPELQSLQAGDIRKGEEMEVTTFLPSKGYEWQNDEWQAKFRELLKAA